MPNLSNLQIIQELCGIVEGLVSVTRQQAEALEQMGAVVAEEERATLYSRYERLLGSGEAPDDSFREEEEDE